MSRLRRGKPGGSTLVDSVQRQAIAPGKRTLTEGLARRTTTVAEAPPAPQPASAEERAGHWDVNDFAEAAGLDGPSSHEAPVQRKADADTGSEIDVPSIAAAGVAASGTALPHSERIQEAFGRHDVSGVKAHVDGPAADAAAAIGAEAYATGQHVAFASPPSLHTAAHEAAHTVQQRGGVQLSGGVGAAGDAYERQADAVADAVVRGESVEALLGDVSSGSAGQEVQRKDSPTEQLPGTSHEIKIAYRRGPWELNGGAVVDLAGDPGANDRATPGSASADLEVLRPKIVTELNSRTMRLEAAVAEGNFDITVIDGLTVGFQVTGPEASLGTDGPELSLAKVGVVLRGDIGKWVGLGAGHVVLELEGSYTIGGKLLAKLAEMAAIGDRIAARAKDLDRAVSELDEIAQEENTLRKKRIDVLTERNMRELGHGGDVPDDIRRATRAGYDEKIRQLDAQIADGQKRRAGAVARIKAAQRDLDAGARKLSKAYDSLDGKVAKLLGGRHVKAARAAIGKVVSRALPILNAIGVAQDIVAVANLFADWVESGYSLPNVGGGGPDAFGKADAPGTDDGTGTGAGQPGGTSDVRSDEAGSGQEGTAGGTRAKDGEHDAPDQSGLHPAARRVLDSIEKQRGFRLDDDQIAAIGHLVPADLAEEQLDALVERLQAKGVRPKDGGEMLAMLADAVRNLTAGEDRITVDGEPVDTEGAPVASKTAPPAAPEAKKGKKKRRKNKKPEGAKDDRVSLDPTRVATWFDADGANLVTNERYDEWRIGALTELEQVIEGVRYMVTEIEASGQITPDGGWDVRIAMRFVEFGGDRTKDEQFRWVLFPDTGVVASVGRGDSAEPLTRFVRAGASPEDRPTVERGAIASFPDYDAKIVAGEVLGRSPGGDGSWRIRFSLVIVEVKNPNGRPIVDDHGKIVELKKHAEIATTLDLVPGGGR